MAEQRGFEDLECYQLARQVYKEAYRVARELPVEEKYNLAPQIRRAAASLLLNIAEGYGRYHYLDTLRFYYIARGSLMEVLSGFIACNDAGYTCGDLSTKREMCHTALRSLNGYIRYVRSHQQGLQEFGNHAIHDSNSGYSVDLNILEE